MICGILSLSSVVPPKCTTSFPGCRQASVKKKIVKAREVENNFKKLKVLLLFLVFLKR